MTTLSQVKRWAQPLLEADARLVLIGRNLVLRPVEHLIRGVYVDQTGSRLRSRLRFYAQPLFAIPCEGRNFLWSREQPTFQIDDGRFEASFLNLCRSGLDDLGQVENIAEFLGEVEKATCRPLGPVSIPRYPLRHSVVLAALGRFAEALRILAPALRDEEATLSKMLSGAQAELAKKSKSPSANETISYATARLRPIAELRPLLSLLEANDHGGVAALLRSHEQHNAKAWRVDRIWEPTPFVFENGL